MPPQLPVLQGLRIVFNGLLSGQPTANVFHARAAGSIGVPPTQTDLDAVAATWRAAWVTNFLPRQSSGDFSLGAVTVQDLGSTMGLIGTATGTTPGTRPGLSLPANVACCISWRVAVHFRGGHCRTYLPGCVQADQTGATSWSTTSVAGWLGAATGFLTQVNAVAGSRLTTMCMLSRQTAGAPRPTPILYDVTGAVVDTRIDSMRRRLGKDR